MDKLLMIADDLTGALDAGVMFSNAGIRTCIDLGQELPAAEDFSVLVKVAETRHVPPQTAYAQVRALTEEAMARGYSCIYKKTDSALRGNPGAELAAVLDGAAAPRIHFVPAFPKMNRVTRRGIQYIDGNIPLAESVFSSDPFNPVVHSDVRELLAETTTRETVLADPDLPEDFEGIGIYDASTREDIHRIAQSLTQSGQLQLLAGCAGFAEVLPEILNLPREQQPPLPRCEKLAVFCGSVNPISQAQYITARDAGAPLLRLDAEKNCAQQAEEMAANIRGTPVSLFATRPDSLSGDPAAIAAQMGQVIRLTAELAEDFIPFIIGGDTLMAAIRALGIRRLFPLGELAPGVVLARYCYQGSWRELISKSGGFGGKDLLMDIYHKLAPAKNMGGVD